MLIICKIQNMKLYTENDLIDLVQSLKDYTHESHTILGHDEREAKEFVDIFLKDRTPIELPSEESLKDKLFTLADEFAFAGYGKTAVILHTIHNGLGNNEQEGGNK